MANELTYRYSVSHPSTGTYMDYWTNDPSGNYWKDTRQAEDIIRARAPQGADVRFCGRC